MKISTNEIFIGIIIFIVVGAAFSILFVVNQPQCGDGVCQQAENGICIADCDWCGDGFCQPNEIGKCKFDCDWCGDGFCQVSESCNSCSTDCGSCKDPLYCGDGVCSVNECSPRCAQDCSSLQCQNGICEPNLRENCIDTPNDCTCNFDEICNPSTKKCVEVKCGNGICDVGETIKTCPNDCKETFIQKGVDPDTNYPIILVHGHYPFDLDDAEYTLGTFGELQNQLSRDGYLNKGILLPSAKKDEIEKGLWGKLPRPVVIRTTYYSGVYDKFGSRIGSEDELPIQTYADRLQKVVETVQHYTGKRKVIIVAHSMGGLVSRYYVKYKGGSSNVHKLVMIGTPNHGIYGTEGLNSLCQLGKYLNFDFRIKKSPTCDQMKSSSSFISNLNSPKETISPVKYYTISGYSGKDLTGNSYDGVVRVASTYLIGAKENRVLNLRSGDWGLVGGAHKSLIIPSKVPGAYSALKTFLEDQI